VLRVHAAVHLTACVRIDVEGRGRRDVRERVRARDDRLRLQRVGVPVERHLPRDDAAEVVLEVDAVDDREQAARASDDEVAAVRRPVQFERLRAPLDAQRRRPAHVSRAQDEPRAAEVVLAPARVEDDEPRRRRDRDPPPLLPEEDADARVAAVRERRPRVVVREDAAEAPAVRGKPLRAVLTHAHTVSPAVAGDEEDLPCLRRGSQGERERRREREPPHTSEAGG
jgi:hypothetical protein